MHASKRIQLALIFLLIFRVSVFAEQKRYIDIRKIVFIESSNNPRAHNIQEDARGLCQIRRCVLQEWNAYHSNKTYCMNDLYDPKVNLEIAEWYLEKRIPQMLRYFKKDVTVKSILICYNAGIDYLVRPRALPRTTTEYIQKYERR